MPLLSSPEIVIRLCGLLIALAASWVTPWVSEGEAGEGIFRSPFVELQAESFRREIVEEDLPGHAYRTDAGINRVTARAGLVLSEGWRAYLVGGGADLEIPNFDNYHGWGGVVYGLGVGRRDRLNFFDAAFLTFTTKDNVETVSGPTREEITWNEYLLRAGVIYPMRRMEPFIGIRLSEVQGVDRLSGSGRLTFDNENAVGLFGGVNVPLTRAVSLTGEFSLLDEEGVRISVGRDF